ncbi:hypothetical protein PVAND_012627 [Polypedilum vanderplanki]|uniref:C2H2-type domain-containing protein n=1 Tax=Polypedilum vanderplanki TaxID=319348 RepID=A0A9J6CMZ9_POLVA|nr:hypothetical protein PVAND_012627 [Polypedilum vanderplanki]
MNEEKSGTFPTYIFVYLDKRTVKNAHVNYLDRSDSSKVDLLHPTTNILDSIFEQFPTFPLFYNADVRMNTWLRILNFELPFTHGEQVRTGLRKYVCKFPVHQNEFCNSSYDKLKGLYQSPKSFHEFKADKTKCNPEIENFKTAAELKEHWQRVHNVLPFKCECCGERFENNQQRSKHKEQEAEGNCRFCGVSIECNLFLSHLESDHRDEKIDTLDETDYEDEE